MSGTNHIDAGAMLDKLQSAVINESSKKQNSEKPKYSFDKLRMYFGEDFVPKEGVVISQPTIGDIVELGEVKFYSAISPFLYNSTSIRLQLWKMGIDWNKVRDIEVFSLLLPTVDKDPLKLFFHDITFDDFRLCRLKPEEENVEGKLAIYSPSQDILLDEDEYMLIAEYIRSIMDFHPKVERAKGKTAKRWIIEEEEMKLAHRMENDDDQNSSTLLPLISTCVNHPGFKYKASELKEVGICEFMDSVKRIQKYESSIAALRGCYSGFVDVSKLDKETLNFMGAI